MSASVRVLVVALFSFLAIILISFFKVALEWEDAEQAFYSQWFRLGYDDQPPLYTWLQICINKILGLNRFSLVGFRAFIFSATLFIMYKFAYKVHKNENLAVLSVLLLFLIPVFIDFNFRRLTHTSLMCLFSLSLYYVFFLLMENKSLRNYILLGLIIGGGLLTKYNFALIIPTFLIIPFFDAEAKQIVWNRYFFISIGVAGLLVSPHLYWLFDNTQYVSELKMSMAHKTKSVANHTVFSSLWAYLKSFIQLSILLFLVFAVAFFRRGIQLKQQKWNSLSKLFIIQFVIASVVFVSIGSSKVSERWLLPIFLPFLVLLFSFFQFKKITVWIKWSFRLFVVVLIVQLVRTPVEKMLKIDSSVHHSFEPIALKLDAFSKKQWVLPDVTYAGSVKFERTKKMVFSSDDFTLPKTVIDSSNAIFVQKEKDANLEIIDSLIGFGEAKEALYFGVKKK